MDNANTQALLSAVRSLLMIAGGALAAHGVINSANLNEIVGAIMVIIPFVWGVWQKYQAEHAAKAREVIAINAGIKIADSTVGPTAPIPSAIVPAMIAKVSLPVVAGMVAEIKPQP